MASGKVNSKLIPNYSSADIVEITGGANIGSVNFTAPKDGICFLCFGFRTDRWIYINVNNRTIAMTGGSSTSICFNNVTVPIRKGDVLTFSNGDGWYAFLCSPSYFVSYE